MDRLLSRRELENALADLRAEYQLWGPREEEGKVYSFRPLSDPGKIAWSYRNSVLSPKSVFFPPGDTVFALIGGKPGEPPRGDQPRLVALIRPCDARALLLLDSVFSGEVEDSLYLSKRRGSLLVGLACDEPGKNCFCASVGGGPFATAGLDLLLVDLGGGNYLVRGISEKGAEIASRRGREGRGAAEQAARREEEAKRRMKITFRPAETLSDDPDFWRTKSLPCLDCGICSFLCPTCHCFDLCDEGGGRKRIWDTCTFPLFTRMTSGENPRELRRERLKNRVFHKFRYFKEIHGEIACVGCGRCLEHCPAGIEITDLAGSAI